MTTRFGTAAPDDSIGADDDLYWKVGTVQDVIYLRTAGTYTQQAVIPKSGLVVRDTSNQTFPVTDLNVQESTLYLPDGPNGGKASFHVEPKAVGDVLAIVGPTSAQGVIFKLRGVLQPMQSTTFIHGYTGPHVKIDLAFDETTPEWIPIEVNPNGETLFGYKVMRVRRTDTSPEATLIHLTRSYRMVDGDGFPLVPEPPNPDGSRNLGSMAVLEPAARSWMPSDYATIGSELYGQRDDEATTETLPGGRHVTFAGTDYTSVTHASNGGLFPGAPAGNSANTAYVTDQMICWAFNRDLVETWTREVVDADGIGWIMNFGPYAQSGQQFGCLVSVRADNNGKWLVTCAANPFPPFAGRINVDGQTYNFLIPDSCVLSDPATWFTLEILP